MVVAKSLLDSLIHNLTTCQHLHTKLPASSANWRPQENMRSTLELMEYLSYIGTVSIRHFVNPPADRSTALHSIVWANPEMTFENFPQMIEKEKNEIIALFEGVTDEALVNKTTYFPWNGQDAPLIVAINTAVSFICAYRHQLFLYAKMQGASIGTMNNWAGMDAPIPAALAEELEEENA